MARTSVKREQLKDAIDTNQILELFVCEYSSQKIADKLGCSLAYVEDVLEKSLSQFYRRNQEYAERASLMHLAKTRALTARFMPEALDGNLQAAQFVLKVIHQEQDIIQAGVKQDTDTAGAEDLQSYEQTLTSTDPRYAIALEHLTENWLDNHIPKVEEMLVNVPQLQADATSNIAALSEKYDDLEESLKSVQPEEDL